MHEASTAMEGREEKEEEAATQIERNLTLIGATAIEDRLQDEVAMKCMYVCIDMLGLSATLLAAIHWKTILFTS